MGATRPNGRAGHNGRRIHLRPLRSSVPRWVSAQFFHVEIMAHNQDEVAMSKITDMLKKAGGANYDSKQNDASAEPNEAFASMKDSASRKFGEMEKQGNVKGTATTAVRRPPSQTISAVG